MERNIDPDLHRSLQEYRDKMEFPMENLSMSIWDSSRPENGPYNDDEIVEIAARKINMLKKMLLATGFNAKMLAAIMEE